MQQIPFYNLKSEGILKQAKKINIIKDGLIWLHHFWWEHKFGAQSGSV